MTTRPRIRDRRDPHAAALDEPLARALPSVALVLSGLYFACLAAGLVAPGLVAGPRSTAVVPMTVLLLIGLLPRWRPIPVQLAGPVLVLVAGLVTVEALGRGPGAAAWQLQWTLIGVGAITVRMRWAVAAAGAVVAPWLAVAAASLGGWRLEQVDAALAIAGAGVVSAAVFAARRSAMLGLVSARRASDRLALTDALTGLRNRRGLEDAAELVMAADPMARPELVLLDLDGFKEVNDRLGHAEGDRALVAVADVLRSTFRAGDVIGRLGGDEFIVIVAPGSDVEVAARRLQERLAVWTEASERYALGASVGTGIVEDPTPEGFWAAVAAADERMYHDKRRRRIAAEVARAKIVTPSRYPGGLPVRSA